MSFHPVGLFLELVRSQSSINKMRNMTWRLHERMRDAVRDGATRGLVGAMALALFQFVFFFF